MTLDNAGMDATLYSYHTRASPQWGGHVDIAVLSREMNLRVHLYESSSSKAKMFAIIGDPLGEDGRIDVHLWLKKFEINQYVALLDLK